MIGNEKFAVCLGDEIFPPWDAINQTKAPLRKLVDAAQELNSSTVGVVEIPIADSPSYGILDLGGKELEDKPLKVLRTVEKPKPEVAPSKYAIIGRYVFDSSLFDALKDTKPGVGGEIQLTDAMDKLCASGKLFGVLLKGCRYDIGNPLF
mgnify:CR=1 FL=1